MHIDGMCEWKSNDTITLIFSLQRNAKMVTKEEAKQEQRKAQKVRMTVCWMWFPVYASRE